MKKLFAVILALVLAASGSAQQSGSQRILYALYDLDSATDISCSFSNPATVSGLATTSGSSTTTTSLNSVGTFNNVSVGDVIWASISGVRTGRVVTAKASANSITVDTAWTIPATGLGIQYQTPTCGASSGWVAVDSGSTKLNLTIDLAQIVVSAGGVAFKVEGRYSPISTSTATNIWPGNNTTDAHCGGGTYASGYCVYTAAESITVTNSGVTFPSQIRLVTKLTDTDSDATPSTDNEKINATLLVVK